MVQQKFQLDISSGRESVKKVAFKGLSVQMQVRVSEKPAFGRIKLKLEIVWLGLGPH